MKKTLITILAAILCFAFATVSFAALPPEITDDPVPGKMGDVTGDGNVDIQDAATLLRILAGLSPSNPAIEVLADVDHNGFRSTSDAAQILRFLAGLSSKVESVFQKRLGDFSFIAEANEATLTIYHSDCPVVIVPRAMEGHRVGALAPDIFAGKDIEIIVFFDGPPEGIEDAGLGDAEILVPAESMEDWESIAVSELVDIPIYFTVSAPDTVYNGTEQPIVATPAYDVTFEISYTRNSSAVAAPVNAGAYTYAITVTEPGYVAVGDITGVFAIDKAHPDMSGVSFVDKEEAVAEQPSDQPVPIYITITGDLPAGVTTVNYWYEYNATSGWIPFEGEKRGGTHIVKAVFTVEEENYHPVADMFAKLKLNDGWGGGDPDDPWLLT